MHVLSGGEIHLFVSLDVTDTDLELAWISVKGSLISLGNTFHGNLRDASDRCSDQDTVSGDRERAVSTQKAECK